MSDIAGYHYFLLQGKKGKFRWTWRLIITIKTFDKQNFQFKSFLSPKESNYYVLHLKRAKKN